MHHSVGESECFVRFSPHRFRRDGSSFRLNGSRAEAEMAFIRITYPRLLARRKQFSELNFTFTIGPLDEFISRDSAAIKLGSFQKEAGFLERLHAKWT
jgi:hypothetical protein